MKNMNHFHFFTAIQLLRGSATLRAGLVPSVTCFGMDLAYVFYFRGEGDESACKPDTVPLVFLGSLQRLRLYLLGNSHFHI